MVFSSPVFLFAFLPTLVVAYHLAPRPARNALLFAASLFFYAWGEGLTVLVLFASLVVNYALARRIERGGRAWLAAGVAANLLLLVGYKYAPFLAANLSTLSEALGGPAFGVPAARLPLGVSFFTFQAVSYLIDVARRDTPAERGFVRFGLYVFLFPHLIAGPIVRYRDLAAQLGDRPVREAQFLDGVRRLAVGLGKKLLLANPLAACADAVFADPAGSLAPSAAWLGLVCYALQIYFDFSGYSDMAIGLGKLFGFDFLENFCYPYTATSVTDFWRRWHLSLSTWFRDYVYVPLGGNRAGRWRTYRNLLLVFLLCGLWHGASWCFVLWGLWHGLFLAAERALGVPAGGRWRPLRAGYALLAVALGWVLFRAADVPAALGFYGALLGLSGGTLGWADYLTGDLWLILPAATIACTPVWPTVAGWASAERPHWSRTRRGAFAASGALLELAGLALLLTLAAAQMVGSTYSPFIYFRF